MDDAGALRPRFFVDENTLPLGRALAAVRHDVLHPGHLRCPVEKGSLDTAWLPYVGDERLVLLTRDIRIRHRSAEKRLFLAHAVKGVFLTKAGSMTRWDMLCMVVQHWDKIEPLDGLPGPWAFSLTNAGLRELKLPTPPA
ncbi:hypothetical protein I6A84_37155 [Frankia sp. CNm7]|uniref:VapC45 PIN like domain-containing protein n=1 Tax=Frankia nepalensis TaxID=1836974 RepID=A0A937RDP0_9ACTN|nr:hypothetical protein [Frankia nepalensis]MBL7499816.1 hypothetical protein [Frankia nepalensis]MBL7511678.1 hypothetical protein [Frankia nepalensis]MBL7523530.1 hypothetical protein [Frankia nepalensis]MBL7628342.1 hypothetical protein [Frankia nepalensis]